MVSEIPLWFPLVAAFIFGATWGSFFNVAIYRWPRDMSVVTPGSHCPSCGTPVANWANVPILGYLMLRGQTACCRRPLSARYPMIEFMSGVLSVAVAHKLIAETSDLSVEDFIVRWALLFGFVGGLVIAAFADLETMLIPDEVSIAGMAVGLSTASIRGDDVSAVAFGVGAAYLTTQVPFVWGWELFTGRRGLGEGDPKLLMFIASFVGWKGALFAFLAGNAQGLMTYVATRLFKWRWPTDEVTDEDELEEQVTLATTPSPFESSTPPKAEMPKIPFGPFLALGAIEYLFLSSHIDQAVTWWLSQS